MRGPPWPCAPPVISGISAHPGSGSVPTLHHLSCVSTLPRGQVRPERTCSDLARGVILLPFRRCADWSHNLRAGCRRAARARTRPVRCRAQSGCADGPSISTPFEVSGMVYPDPEKDCRTWHARVTLLFPGFGAPRLQHCFNSTPIELHSNAKTLTSLLQGRYAPPRYSARLCTIRFSGIWA